MAKRFFRAVERALPWFCFTVSCLLAIAEMYANAAWVVGAAIFLQLDNGTKLTLTIHQPNCPDHPTAATRQETE